MVIIPGSPRATVGGGVLRARAKAAVFTSPPPAELQKLGVPRLRGRRPVGAPKWVRLSPARVQRGAVSASSPGLALRCAAPGGTGVGFGSWTNLVFGLTGLWHDCGPSEGCGPLTSGADLSTGLGSSGGHSLLLLK